MVDSQKVNSCLPLCLRVGLCQDCCWVQDCFLFSINLCLKEIHNACEENRVKLFMFPLMPVVSDSSSEGWCSGSVTTDGRDRIFFTASLSHLFPHSLFSLGESETTQRSLSAWRRAVLEEWRWILLEKVSWKFGRGRYSSLTVSALRWLRLSYLPTLLLSCWSRWGCLRDTQHCVQAASSCRGWKK